MSTSQDKSICFVIPNYVTFSTGGAEIQVHYLTQGFLDKGWNVEVVCAGIGHEKEIEESELFNPKIKYFYYKKLFIRSLEFLTTLRVIKRTTSQYYYQRTDFALTASTLWYCRTRGKKFIYALASDSDVKKGKYSSLFKEFKYISKWKMLVRKVDFFLLDKLIEWAKKNSKHVVCQNQYQLENYKINFGKEGVIIPNSFNINKQFDVTKQNVVLWVGNNKLVKQPQIFVDVAKYLERKSDWSFVMIGDATNDMDKTNLPKNLQILGPLSYNETNKWFAKAKIYINTSNFEGMPNTFIQSWFFGILIFSLNVNPHEVFTRYNAGCCFNGNIEELKKELLNFAEGKNYCDHLNNGREYFKSSFDLDKNVNKLISYILS